jgi:acyl transferase domain-containing protein
MYTGLARGHFLSTSGQCKPFDSAADGYCRAEGCGLVVLKKLSHALAENDTVYGVIRGIGVNQCGTAISITHPDHETQATLFRQVLETSKIRPESINVVEAHGTGTQAGDAAEVSSVTNVFGVRLAENPLWMGTVKGNIGHAEAASGVAGLLKLLVMMQKKQIPPQASFSQLNPGLAKMMSHNIIVQEKLEDWRPVPSNTPRRAMLNNFGAAGSNAVLILEEHIAPTRRRRMYSTRPGSPRTQHVLNLSAKSEKAIEALRCKYISYITLNPDVPIESLCYSANARRLSHTAYRLSVVGHDLEQLVSRLKEARIKFRIPTEVMRTPIFVFSGQVSTLSIIFIISLFELVIGRVRFKATRSYTITPMLTRLKGNTRAGMGAELYGTAPTFRDAVVECDDILSRNEFPTVAAYISGNSEPSWVKDQEDIVVQCAIFVLEYALARLWMAWGVKPQIVLGHR